eukprot:SAG31_NODE_10851_length_1090_cov_1.467205_1_plen_77_part_00
MTTVCWVGVQAGGHHRAQPGSTGQRQAELLARGLDSSTAAAFGVFVFVLYESRFFCALLNMALAHMNHKSTDGIQA